MVRAILDGRKTQTRRVVRGQLPNNRVEVKHGGKWVQMHVTDARLECPYGLPGDLLWVRETFVGPLWPEDEEWPEDGYTPKYCRYAADGGGCPEYENLNGDIRSAWTPSIHMPRWASRITLEITGVRVERLQDISESDALEEGITYNDIPNNGLDTMRARTWFRGLWSSIYGEESWHANPWVWVIEFNPHLKNVDEMLKV